MTEQMVREQIARLEFKSRNPQGKWDDMGDIGAWKIECFEIADQILNLTDPEGNRLLGIMGKWQEKPDSEGWWWFEGYFYYSRPMRIWVKVPIFVSCKPLGWFCYHNGKCCSGTDFEGQWSKAVVPVVKLIDSAKG